MCHIRLSVYSNGKNVILTIFDDGIGMDQETICRILQHKKSQEHTLSYGLSNVIERLAIVYGSDATLSINSKQGEFTIVELLLPGG